MEHAYSRNILHKVDYIICSFFIYLDDKLTVYYKSDSGIFWYFCV
jgi:hypothetical protein